MKLSQKALGIGVFLASIWSNVGFARIVYVGDEMETITLSYGGPTIVRFPTTVKTISQATRFAITPADEEQPNYALLSVTPRFSQGEDKVTFIMSDGSIINTKLVVVPKTAPEKTDSFYDLKRKDSLIENAEANDQTGERVSELELMKAMIRGDHVAGYQIKKLIRTIDTKVSGVNCQLVRVYTGAKFNGYIFKISSNAEGKDFEIDVTKLTLGSPNTAILSQIDESKISGSEENEKPIFLRIVAKPASVYYDVNLPVAAVKKEKEQGG
ncbi:MAG: type-F conjugative transfer system secretin TraK [Proteobacteria bacterium]|nr:type-F conjugative transfer system secretin TraK [Pseudomonadota bacterium]